MLLVFPDEHIGWWESLLHLSCLPGRGSCGELLWLSSADSGIALIKTNLIASKRQLK